ncbi:pyridoxamine 5'-phosphate oxidase family protein [Bacillus tuaregi]|uniref:pyridoxamine 5'-phosphate oxidase family protein n=1 Tax=Bacillus tuaregi TaxID=1816695 RepID=UPI0008F87E13|nr:pyridoxamine 5'-phosphate oxidase family protein [Bacillus tuaregi]
MLEPTVTYQDKIESEEELRAIIGYPSELVKRKVITYVDNHCKEFISRSPFVVVSTSDERGLCDVSPRGDMPGFVLVLDEKHIVIPERPGNKRSDTLRNILANPYAGLLFLIPGLGETLRVNGKASLVKDDQLLERMAVKGKKPLLGICVEVEECFIHCAKSIIRSGLWKPEAWIDKTSLPNASKILAEHVKLPGMNEEQIKNSLDDDYKTELY